MTAGMIIREARPEDAAALIAHVHRLLEEPAIDLVTGPGEFTLTVEEERDQIDRYARADNCCFLVAEAAGQIVGLVTCKGGSLRAVRHAVRLGISVRREWRDRGIGSALLAAAITWARDSGVVTRIELDVYARNARAWHVYEKVGFVVEGCRRRAIVRDGVAADMVVMGLLLDQAGPGATGHQRPMH